MSALGSNCARFVTKSKTLFYLSLAFILGLFLSLKFNFPFVVFLPLPFLFFKKPSLAIIVLFLLLGLWRGSFDYHQEIEKYQGKEALLKGRISKEPDVRENNTKLEIETEQGKVLATVSKFSDYSFGDKVEFRGKILAPPVFESFNYKDYLKKDGISSVVYYPDIKLLEKGSSFYNKILSLKERMRNVLYDNLSPPHSFVLGAMVLGDKSRMPDYLKEKLNRSGLRHITAVSGFHIVVLSGILMSFLLALGFWRGQAFYLSFAVMFLFVVFVGFHASAVRAGLMAAAFLLAEKLGRKGSGSRILVFIAALMLLFNPFLLLYDAGFQLSFLAVLGIIFFNSFFKDLFSFLPSFFKEITAVTFSAQVFTLPLLIYQFGTFSLATPLSNLFVLPIVYWIMILGFVFLFLGLLSSSLAFILSFPCFILLSYLSFVADIFSRFFFSGLKIHWIWLLAFYLFLFFLAFILRKKKLSFLRY